MVLAKDYMMFFMYAIPKYVILDFIFTMSNYDVEKVHQKIWGPQKRGAPGQMPGLPCA